MIELSAVKKRFGLSNLQLKIIAVVSMIIDHAAHAIPWFGTVSAGRLYWLMRYVGRLAFPIFAFLIAEGAVKTKSIGKYLLRLAVFAVICEIPFDLMEGRFFYWGHQNTILTMFLGLLAIAAYQWFLERKSRWGDFVYIASFLWILGCMVLATLTKSDYKMAGVLLIVGFYLWRTEMARIDIFPLFLMLVMATIWRGNRMQLFALLAFFPILLYNGNLGKKMPRYTFYGVYLGHLILLALLRYLVTKG